MKLEDYIKRFITERVRDCVLSIMKMNNGVK